jgi:UDP-N-acetylmuramyl pentapeptide phosphotransferase/UDP-N-acetylglucosamine-1-phosphate transferase
MDIVLIKSGVTAFVFSVAATPFLILLSRKKGFYASINHRSSHESNIPNTGGIILCFAVVVPVILFSNYLDQEEFNLLLAAFAVLLITGIIDDFNPIPVFYKFLGQFVPAIVIVMSLEAQYLLIPFVHNFTEIPGFFNYLFWIFFIVMSINAFNLIDGIDGLAIGLGIVGGAFYFLQFLKMGLTNMAVFSISLLGGLFGLLFFNLSRKNKIFIGDTGSLLIGGLLVFFGLKYMNLPTDASSDQVFFLVFGSMFIPLADMVRVVILRTSAGYSPFRADRKHIHHLIVDACKGNHLLASSIIVAIQIGMISFFVLMTFSSNIMYFTILFLATITYVVLVSLFSMLGRKSFNIFYD